MDGKSEKLSKEISEKYRDVELSFSQYYKFTFYYRGIAPDGAVIICGMGGDSGDIYRSVVRHDDKREFEDTDSWSTINISLNDKEIYELLNY